MNDLIDNKSSNNRWVLDLQETDRSKSFVPIANSVPFGGCCKRFLIILVHMLQDSLVEISRCNRLLPDEETLLLTRADGEGEARELQTSNRIFVKRHVKELTEKHNMAVHSST